MAAAGLNRTDVIQRGGRANLPEGASDILGLEVSGTIAQLGSDVSGISVGDEVVALTDSGGYAEYVAVPAGQVAPVPPGLDLLDAAGIPEVAATVVLNVMLNGRYQEGETVLVHGGTGGMGGFRDPAGQGAGRHGLCHSGQGREMRPSPFVGCRCRDQLSRRRV
ncbi:alcohol dehydrogenase catalytic domain-containing protein [Glutamicibacter arilaitensis]|uniref:alcohol dehydrogenase catalytic domain-containing protein n=1 Tax=Glutamicibacter arilaitensis TaxID=256701 RepID=UPI003F90CFD0